MKLKKRRHAASHESTHLLDVPATARWLGISTRTLRNLVVMGRIPVIHVSAHRIAFDPADLERYVTQQRR